MPHSGSTRTREASTVAAAHTDSPVETARRFAQFVELAPDAIVGVGRDGLIVLVNAQTEALFGHARDALIDQMRRLESVGQLAGGIAHDFNNLLAVILNYAEFVAEGTGLGLATVYGIVMEAGGVVQLYSEPGVGTTVKAYLPASAGAVPAQETTRTSLAPSRGEAVLVVEDEDAVRRLTERILARVGYRVTAAASAEAALAAFAGEGAVDLLLTDVIMPEMLGPELVERASALRPRLRVLYMSGYTHQAIARRQVTGSDVAFVEKPFTAQALLAAVRDALDMPVPGTEDADA